MITKTQANIAAMLAKAGRKVTVIDATDETKKPVVTELNGRRITNDAGLPEPLVAAVRNDTYNAQGSDITVTTLLKPPRAVALEKLHRDEIVEDASDRLWSLVGQIGHSILERAGKDMFAERRLFTKVRGWKVSGQVDLIPPDVLIDYKFTTVWSCKEGLKPEWEQQLNLLHLLCVSNGIPIVKAQVVAIYRDWSKLEARRSPDYPRHQVQVFDVPLWSFADAEAWLEDRVQKHQAAQSALEKNLPECAPGERWAKPSKWAIHKEGRERAVKLHDTEASAQEHLSTLDAKHRIEHRPGEQVRCQSYCSARPWCLLADKLGVPKE